MQSVNLPIDLINSILSYLGSKPFNEVAQLITNTHTAVNAELQKNMTVAEPKSEVVEAEVV